MVKKVKNYIEPVNTLVSTEMLNKVTKYRKQKDISKAEVVRQALEVFLKHIR
jgi:hypothetical protein